LHAAAYNGHDKAVKLLRKLGANMNVKSAACGIAVEVAQDSGHDAVAETLVRYTSQCARCQKKATATVKLPACSQCRKTYYCSTACQKQNWKQHKKTCSEADDTA
jgi:ankyrin repeat protein